MSKFHVKATRIFVPVSQPSPLGLGGYHGGPIDYVEVPSLDEVIQCPIDPDVRKGATDDADA